MPIKLVIFDMAGTTVKDEHFVANAFSQAMERNNYPVPTYLVNSIMGYKKAVAIRMLLKHLETDPKKITTTLIDRIHNDFIDNMTLFYQTYDSLTELPGVEKTFATLRNAGVKVALGTGFPRSITDVIVERLAWHNRVDAIVASDEVPEGRPAPYMIRKIMRTLKIASSDEVAKVGDTEVDIHEGINSGCKYIVGITTGSFTRQQLERHNPTHIIDHISEVPDIVLPLN